MGMQVDWRVENGKLLEIKEAKTPEKKAERSCLLSRCISDVKSCEMKAAELYGAQK